MLNVGNAYNKNKVKSTLHYYILSHFSIIKQKGYIMNLKGFTPTVALTKV